MAEQTYRLLQLLSLLQARRDWSGPEIAGRLEVSERTVRRDIERLRALGYRVGALTGPDGGYRLEGGADLPPLLFDDDQAVALAIALESNVFPGSGIEEGAARALATLRQVLPSRLRHRLDGMPVTSLSARPGDSPPPVVPPEVLVELSATVRDCRILRVDYSRADTTLERNRLEPHGLITLGGRWYLLAWDLDNDGWRTLRVDRLVLRPPHGALFTPRAIPGGSVAAFVSARFKGSDHVDRWPCEGAVVLDLPARGVHPFAGDGTVEELADERCRLRAGSWSWGALAAAFLRFEADIDGVEPPALAEAFAVLARRAHMASEVGA
ncbi:helix-turn-helix transcriptional regulator [Brachybacterium fresconis]|uniref:DNA-binding transcriptional regulator YafY n=1 Tax=Brachybacterium fresconis TaxID=173363 RepID=A0ABS4YJ64_9MICO|nr:WYL domain-containing protein [Brachybacterium fresconis]MBP2408462.1 putative DNA-binding transcriptional regulator YafY [Brachybacterium fresconis]